MKVSQQAWANIFKVVAIAIFVFIIYSVSSCSSNSSCSRTKRYWRNHRCVQVTPKQQQLNYIHNPNIS